MPSPFAVGVDIKRQKSLRLRRLQQEARDEDDASDVWEGGSSYAGSPHGSRGRRVSIMDEFGVEALASCKPVSPGSPGAEWVDDADDYDEEEEARAQARIQRNQRKAFAERSRQQQQLQSGRSLLFSSSALPNSPGSADGRSSPSPSHASSKGRARQGLAMFIGAMDSALTDSPSPSRPPKRDRAADMMAAVESEGEHGGLFGGAAAFLGVAQGFVAEAMTDASSEERVLQAMRRLPMRRVLAIWRNQIAERRERARRFKQANAEGVYKWQLFYRVRPHLVVWVEYKDRQNVMKHAVHMMRGSDRRGALYALQEHAMGESRPPRAEGCRHRCASPGR